MKTATITEIATALGISRQAVSSRAKKNDWQATGEIVRGGGDKYSVSEIPLTTTERKKIKKYLSTLQITQTDAVAVIPEISPAPARTTALTMFSAVELPMPSALRDSQRACMDARLGLMRFIENSLGNATQTIEYLVKGSHAGTLQPELQALVPVANARADKLGKRALSERSLWRWWKEHKASDGNCVALAPASQLPRIEAPWVESFMKCWKKPQKPKLTEVLEDLQDKIPAGIAMPSYDQARRYLLTLGALELNKGRMTGNALATLKPYRRRLTDHMLPGDCYTADGHAYDAEVAHPYHGQPFRPEITPVLDVATRMVVGWSCDLAESGLAVLDALRGACETFGPCVIFYTDNGKGFKNQMMTGPGIGILSRCGITPEYSRPRNPQAHGISERAHQTILIKSARELCTYIGKDMDSDAKQLVFKKTRAELKAGESSGILIEWYDFIEHVNQAIVDYNNRPHKGLPSYRDPATRKRCYLSPAQAWQLGIQRMQKDLPQVEWLQPANELPDLYHPAVERTVDRGWVRLGMNRNGQPKMYYGSDLVNWHGERVTVAFSPSDPAQVWVRDLAHGRLIAVAKLNGNSDPYFAQSYIDEKREVRADARLKRVQHKIEEIELERRGSQPITISSEAAAARENLVIELTSAPVPEPAAAAPARSLPAAAPSQVRPVFSLPATQRGKYQYWGLIDARISAGEEITEDEKRFHSGYQTTTAWKTERMLDVELEPVQAAK